MLTPAQSTSRNAGQNALRDDRSAERLQVTVLRAELAALIDRFTGTDGVHATAIPRLTLSRVSHTQYPVHTVYEPAFCVLAQGSKRILFGEHVDGACAGHRVGYESQQQFNREYSRFFGLPPVRDVKRLRELQMGSKSG